MTTDSGLFEGFVVLELAGNQKLVGFAREVVIAGVGFIQISIRTEIDSATLFYPVSLVRSLRLTSEEGVSSQKSVSEEVERSKYEELSDLFAQLTDEQLIDFLATLTLKDGRYKFSANRISGLIGGDRSTTLTRVREIREASIF